MLTSHGRHVIITEPEPYKGKTILSFWGNSIIIKRIKPRKYTLLQTCCTRELPSFRSKSSAIAFAQNHLEMNTQVNSYYGNLSARKIKH